MSLATSSCSSGTITYNGEFSTFVHFRNSFLVSYHYSLIYFQALYPLKSKVQPERMVDGRNCYFFDDLDNLDQLCTTRNPFSLGALWLSMLRFYRYLRMNSLVVFVVLHELENKNPASIYPTTVLNPQLRVRGQSVRRKHSPSKVIDERRKEVDR